MEILYIVIPCFNERDVLPETAEILRAKLTRLKENGIIAPDSRVLFVNNHSEDGTFDYIVELARKHPESFTGISLSTNCGQQNALLAGLETAVKYADIMITIDADLQDDPEVIDEMLKKHAEGAEIVCGVRNNRESDTVFKRATANLYYRAAKALGMKIIPEHADFRLMNRRSVMALKEFKEKNLFLRGIVPLIGFESATVSYKRGKRNSGESKYRVKDLLAFAFNSIISFSIKPLRFIFVLGLIELLFSVVFFVLWMIPAVKETSFLIIWIALLCSGGNLLATGIVGEYIGRIFLEVKDRPRYIIDRNLLESRDQK